MLPLKFGFPSACLEETTGISGRDEAGRAMEVWYAVFRGTGSDASEMAAYPQSLKVEPTEGLTYERFVTLVEEVDQILGGGSSYKSAYRSMNAKVPVTYEDAAEAYRTLCALCCFERRSREKQLRISWLC